jgi:hypothetical protein
MIGYNISEVVTMKPLKSKMLTANEVINLINELPDAEKMKVFRFLLEQYSTPTAFDFWNNPEDDVYNDL